MDLTVGIEQGRAKWGQITSGCRGPGGTMFYGEGVGGDTGRKRETKQRLDNLCYGSAMSMLYLPVPVPIVFMALSTTLHVF